MTTLLPRGTGTRTAAPPRPTSRPGPRPSVPPADGRARALATPPRAPVPLRSGPRLPFVAMILLLLGGGLCALLALNTASAAGEVQERDLANQARTLSDTEQDLRREVAGVEAPAALAAAARALGMVPGTNPAFLVIGADGSVTVLGDPKAAPLPAPPPLPSAAASPDPSATPTPVPATGVPPSPDPSSTPTPAPSPAPGPAAGAVPNPAAAPTPNLPTAPPAGQ